MAYNDFVALVREKTKKNTTAAERSAAVGASAVDRMVDYMKYQRIGFDKLGEDINALVSGAQGYLEGGWADGNATAAQKQSVGSMISRLKSAKQYYTNHPEQFGGDVSKSIAEIDRTLGSLTELSGYIDKAGAGYANYGSREEYDKAISDYTFTSQYKDMSADELEHIVSDLKFLKWGHDMNGNGFALHGVNQDNYGERIAHLESLLAEKQVGNYVEWAKQQGDFAGNASYIDPGKEYKDAEGLEKIYMLLANPTLAYSDNVFAEKGYNPFDTSDPLKKLYGIFQAVGQTAEAGKMLEMSADERKTFYYLYNTGQTEQAEKYINALTDISGKRLSEDVNSFVTNMAAEHPWLSTIAAIGTDIVISLPNTIETIANAVVGGKYDRYSGFNILGGATDTIYSTVPRVWAEKYGWDKDMTSFIYSTGVSIAQNVGTSLLFGGYGGTKIGKIASLAAMGTQASGSTMRKLAEQGAQDWQIYTLGAISGVAEVAMEKVPLDKLIKIGKEGGKAGLKATLKNIVNQIGTEFTEEAATEIVNILADSIVRLNESELATAVGEKGLLAALKDSIGQVIMAGASGAVSGGFMGSVFSIYGGTVGSEQYRQVGKFIVDNGAANTLIEQGLKLGQGSEAYEIAELLKRRMTNNREGKLNATSYADVGRLYALETVAVREQYMQVTENKLSVKLEAAGVKSSKAEGLAAALAKAISGEQMTRAETRAIGKSAQAMQILEQSKAMLDPSRVAFNPIQKSTTYAIADGAMVITRLGNSNMYRVDLLPSANAERVASTGEIGDGAVRTLESQSVRQVEQMVKKAAEGAGIADISSGFGEQISPDAAVAVTMLSAEMSGVNENVAGIAAGIAEAMGGDLRIVFDPELSKTGDTGIYRKNYDGTREAQIAPTLGGMVSTLAHELFHDIEDTAAGKAFVAAAVEYAKTQPARNPENGANRYEEVKHLYQTRKGVSDKAELETEVGAKIAGDILASEDALMAVLEHMKPQQKASLWQRLKRALTSLRDKLKGQKNAKPAETQLNVLERLYKQAFAQRVIQDAVENPRVGDPNAVSEQKGKKTPTEGESSANDRQVTGKLNSDQKEKAPEREADVAAQNAQKAVFGSEKVEDDTSGSFGVKACLSEADDIGQKSIAYNERHSKVNAAVLKVGVEVMMEMAETMKPYLEEEGILPPDTNRNNGKTLFKNGSYGRTAENTTKCIRTLTYDDFKDRVAEEIGRPLTVAESLLVSQKIYDIATDPQCIYCYVAADRKAYDEYLGEYHAAMDKYIKALKDGGDSDELYQEYIYHNPKNDTKARRRRWEAWKKLARSGGKYITAADLATSAKRNAIIDQGGALAEQVKDAQRYAQSASWAKKVEEYRAYNGEILKLTQQLVDRLNDEYGLRMYSFSDYTPAFIVENMQMIIDAACRGLKSLAYTKDTDYAKIFARTGQAINISCFAKWQDGVYVEDNRQGADWAEAKKLREQYPNVGIVMVAVTEPMVEWAVRQDWVDVVIPYHIVKTGTKIANEYQWRNFTADSADKAGNRVANIYPTEHNNDFATYKRLIEERGLTPRFNEYYERVAKGELTPEQYMKLVNEVRLPASELSAVVPDFDLDAARESFGVDAEGNVIKGGFVDKGGYMGSWYREGVDVEQAAMQVADDIRAGKSSLDVEYGTGDKAKLIQAKKYGVIKADVAEDEIPNSSREYAQMKREEEKRAASEKRKPTATYKAYNTSHMIEVLRGASKVITADAINEITGKNLAYVRTDRDSVTSLARKLSEEFNLAQENGADEKKIRAIADAIADEVINDTYADDVDVIDKLTKDKDITYRTLNILQHGIGRMLLSDDDINGIYNQNKNKDARRIVSRWRAAKNMRKTYLPSQIANELAAESVTLDIAEDAWNESNILLALDKLYINAKAAYEEAVRKQIGTAEEYAELKQKISDQVFEAFREGEADVRVAKAQAAAKVIVDVTRAKELARRKRETGRLSGKEWKDLVESIGKIATTYNVSVPAVRAFAKAYVGFVSTQAHELHEMLTDTEGSESAYEKYAKAKKDGENQVLESIDPRIARGIYAIAEGDEGTVLTADELEALHAGLRNLLALDNRYNRVHMDGRWENTDKYAKQGIADSESEYGSDGKKQIGVGWVKQVEDPYDVASSVGGHNRDSVLAKAVRVIQHAATEAQYKEMQYMKEVEDFFDSHKAFRKKYRDQRIEFKTVRKNPVTGQQVEGSVTMTLGEFLGLYMTSKRKQAFISLAMSDIVFDKMPGVRDHEQRLAGLKMQYEGLTEVQIEAAMRGMGNALIAEIGAQYEKIADDDIRAFVAAVERFFNEVSTREKTETDLLLYGYTNVLGGYYYPLERDKNAFDVNLIGNDRIIGNMIGVGNFSFNKATVERASKPLMIRDTMTVMRRHAHQLATYTTMTVPLQNINRIYNCKVNDTTLKDFIHNNVWAGFGKYLRNYLLDVQGSRRADTDFEELRSILSTIKSNYAKSALAINPKSILTQFSTVIAMQGQVSYSSWAKGLAMAAFLQRTEGEDGKVLARLAEMDKYSHGAAVRNDSNEIYLATGAVGKLGNVTDKLMIGQLVTDRLTCFAMYSMCQYEVQRTQGLAVGTAENKAAAGKMLDEMILNLQDTSAAATKTALARSTSEVISNFAMFKSAELKQFSRIAYALADMRAHGVTRARVGAFSKELGAFLGSKVYAAVIALAWAAFRGRWEEDDEGKDKGYIEMLASELFMDMVGFVPVFGSLAENVMTGFGLELPSESVVNDLITAIRSTGGIISDIADGGSFEFKKAVNILSSAGQALGLPVRNLANVVEGAFNMAGLADSRIKYNYDKFMSGGSATVNDLREAINAGDERLAETVADMLMVDRVGSSVGSEAAGEIVSLYASGETGVLPSKIGSKITVSINDESREIELTAAEQRELRAEYGKATGAVRRMVSTSAYSRLTTSERAVAVRDMNRLYMDRAKAKLHGADMTTAVAMTCLMSEGKYICAYAHIKAIKADKTVKNKATQIKRWLRSQGLSVAEQRAILYASGYRSEENLAAVKRLLRSASLSAKEKTAVRAALSIE